jgi:hypothetical protein
VAIRGSPLTDDYQKDAHESLTLQTASYIRTDSVAKAAETGSCNLSTANVPIAAIATIATQATTKTRIRASCDLNHPQNHLSKNGKF